MSKKLPTNYVETEVFFAKHGIEILLKHARLREYQALCREQELNLALKVVLDDIIADLGLDDEQKLTHKIGGHNG